jgi:hypothetical protein
MSRPARTDTPATAWIHVRITIEERRDLEQLARQNLVDISGVIREAVNVYCADCQEGRPPFRDTKHQPR